MDDTTEAAPPAPSPEPSTAPIAPPRPPVPVVTIALIAINLIVFGITLALGADALQPTAQKMIELGGNLAPLTLDGEEWRLVTSMFLHYGVLHIAMNMIGLWSGGRLAESMYGKAGFASLYVIAGLAGGLASAGHKAATVSAGASGAIFGVFGAIGAFLLAHRHRFSAEVIQKEARGLGAFLLYNVMFGFSQKTIDMSAHLGGLAAGFVVGLALEYGRTLGSPRALRVALVTALGLGATAAAAFTVPVPASPVELRVYQDLDKVEQSTIPLFSELLGAVDAGSLTKEAAADRVDRELVAPWADLQKRIWAHEAPNQRLEALHAALRVYIDARVVHFTALAEYLRGRTDDATVEDRGKAVEAALERINNITASMKQP